MSIRINAQTTNMGKTSGFSVANYWVEQYSQVSGKKKTLTTRSKIDFNKYITHVKDQYSLNSEGVMRLIDFMYAHNPLGLEDIKLYGQVKMLDRCAPYFLRWRKANDGIISTMGERNAIGATAPVLDQVDRVQYLEGADLAAAFAQVAEG
jgi:hypothetical protein